MSRNPKIFSLSKPLKLIFLLTILDIIIASLIVIVLGALAHFQVYNVGLDMNDFWISFAISFFKIISGYYFMLYVYLFLSRSSLNYYSFFSLLLILIVSYLLSTAFIAMMGKSDDWFTTYINAYKLKPPYITHIGLISSILSLLSHSLVKTMHFSARRIKT